ncbi:MAG TPA: branched-chain amino acid ABC transporter permease [Alphaproteobacteria bacterium]|nr:branched-chain amino acid ABC transporter permease [Alphaproteobacteria bacterium]
MSVESVAQVLASGLLMGLIYALIAAGLSLIFGLMDIVNFAHGEFLMTAMYLTFGLHVLLTLDPLALLPVVAALMFLLGVLVYRTAIRRAMQAKTSVWMAQIFVTFGLAIMMRGLAQLIFTPEYRSIRHHWLSERSVNLLGVYLSLPQLAAAGVCLLGFLGLYLLIARTDFGRALEATREDKEAVALVGINRDLIFALGWGIGGAVVGIAGVMLATFYYIYPGVGANFALVAFITVALGGFGSLGGALLGGVIIGLVEAVTAMLVEPSLKSIGIYAVYMLVVLLRPRGLFGYL